jgi:hypothetical protein
MILYLHIFTLFLLLALTSACSPLDSRDFEQTAAKNSSQACMDSPAQNTAYYLAANNGSRIETVRVSGTGYGAPPKNYYPESQRRLMAMRASKIDAYRALAETINGLHIWGGTTIGDMVVQKDRYRTFLDAFVRGARIIGVNAHEDGSYETVVETVVDQNFLSSILTAHQHGGPDCSTTGNTGQVVYNYNGFPSSFYYSE